MSSGEKETDFYEPIAREVHDYLKDITGSPDKCFVSHNREDGVTTFRDMHRRARMHFGLPSNTGYVPAFRPDIAGFVLGDDFRMRVVLIEVKLGKSLGLAEFSQLLGYMHLAQYVSLGILVLVSRGMGDTMSPELSAVINTGQLPLTWSLLDDAGSRQGMRHQIGIGSFSPGGKILLTSTNNARGFSNWSEVSGAMGDPSGGYQFDRPSISAID